MKRFFLALAFTATASSPYAQTIYLLNATGSGKPGESLGIDATRSASSFYEFMKDVWKIPTIEPIYKNQIVDNVEDLIPDKVFVVPELVTIRASQFRGSQFDYNRQHHPVASPMPVTVNPAEDSVFIFAMNKAGQLIYPFVRSHTGDGKDYDSTYSIVPFKEHSNFPSSTWPIVANSDVDLYATYDKDQPGTNPPNALMFRGRMAGRYSLALAVRFNSRFLSVGTPENVKAKALSTIVMKTVEIDVVNGPETIDALLFNISKPQGMHDQSKTLSIGVKEGEEIEVSLSGRKNRMKWQEDIKQYRSDGSANVMLKEMSWTYNNNVLTPANPLNIDFIGIRKLTADGTSVRILGKLPPGMTEGKGTITMEGHGRSFTVNVTVKK